jgi:hypothetical protein
VTPRAAIVGALATVAGLHPTPSRPVTVTQGSAWPVWVRSTYEPGLCGTPAQTEWQVVVPIPPVWDGDALDIARDTVAAALWTVGTVESAEPDEIEVSSDGVQQQAVVITLTTNP